MPQDAARLRVSSHGEATVVEFTDRKILDEVSIALIGEELTALAQQASEPRMVLDFSDVIHLSSSALGMLITLHKRVRERNGQLRLCGIQPSILEVFQITRLNEVFQIAETRQEALDSLS